MQSIGQALKEAITNMTPSPSEDHICPHCEQAVPKITLFILGVEKVVQPHCKCEVEAWESGIQEAVERKQKNDIERKFSISSLGDRFDNSTFEAFTNRYGAEKVVTLAKQYADTFPNYGGEALLIYGEPGNGKSHLAAAVCHTIKEKGKTIVFQSVPELLERIRHTFQGRKNSENEREIMNALLECDLLVLDDIGAEKVSDWVQDVLFRIVDGRYRQKRPIFYTSNLKPSELRERLGPRICDRVMETSIIVENKATSYRLEVAKARFQERAREA